MFSFIGGEAGGAYSHSPLSSSLASSLLLVGSTPQARVCFEYSNLEQMGALPRGRWKAHCYCCAGDPQLPGRPRPASAAPGASGMRGLPPPPSPRRLAPLLQGLLGEARPPTLPWTLPTRAPAAPHACPKHLVPEPPPQKTLQCEPSLQSPAPDGLRGQSPEPPCQAVPFFPASPHPAS